jgi:hypothetical protein
MRVYLSSTANLGDFFNAIPVLSGLSKSNGKFELIIKGEMKKFNGIHEFLMYQDLFSEVTFDSDVWMYGEMIHLSSWTREDKGHPDRPIETCRYENWLRDNYPNLQFTVDDDFILKVKDYESLTWNPGYYGGDRWSGPGIDTRRNANVLGHLANITFLDYNRPMMENVYYIKNCNDPFISTFTGISGIADLLNKKQLVLWGDDIRNWDNKPITYSFEKHYYGNRNSRLMYIGDFEMERINDYFNVQE